MKIVSVFYIILGVLGERNGMDNTRWIWSSPGLHHSEEGVYSLFVQTEERENPFEDRRILCLSIYDTERKRKYMLGVKAAPRWKGDTHFVHDPLSSLVLDTDEHGSDAKDVSRAYAEATQITGKELRRAQELWENACAVCVTDRLEGRPISPEAENLINQARSLFDTVVAA